MSITFGIPVYKNTSGTEATCTMRLTAVDDACKVGMKKCVKICMVIDDDLILVEGYLDYEDIKEASDLL